jgi:putative ABC transport system permease protein
MKLLLTEIQHSIRAMIKNPRFIVPSILVLAIGIAALTEIFSVVNRVIVHPLPFPDQDRIMMVWENNLKLGIPLMPASAADFSDWQEQNQVFDGLAAISTAPVSLTGVGDPERIAAVKVSNGFFSILGIEPALGRTFLTDEDAPGRNTVVVLSYGLWQRSFGADKAILGKKILLNDVGHTVVGIMPDGFQFPNRTELWVPLALTGEQRAIRVARSLRVVSRLKKGIEVSQAQASMSTIASQLQQQYPDTNAGYGVFVNPLKELVVGPARQDLMVILIAAGFVLLIAITNVGSMLLARGAGRAKEFAVKIALGATRRRIILQLLTESFLLTLMAAAIGLGLAYWGVKVHSASVPDFVADNNPAMRDIHIDWQVFLFVSALALLTALIFGLIPAFLAWRTDVNRNLKEGGKGSGKSGGHRLRDIIVIVEVALGIVLSISAGLNAKSYSQLLSIDIGYNPKNAVVMDIAPLESKYSDGRKIAAFYKSVLENVKQVPGVENASVASVIPLAGRGGARVFQVENAPPPPPGEELRANFRVLSPDYFASMQIPILAGRDFTESDVEATPKAIISSAMRRKFWPTEDPLGKRIIIRGETKPREIVGVVGDIKEWDLTTEPLYYIYVPYLLERPIAPMTLVARTSSGDPLSLAPSVRSQVFSIDKDQPVYNISTLEKMSSDARWPQRMNMAQLIVFSIIALLLAASGIYGLLSYSVSQRTYELGLRIALGAQRSQIVGLIIRQGMKLVLIGSIIGVAAAFAFTRILSSLLFGVSTTDPVIYLAVPAIIAATSFLSCLLPAIRATRVSPLIAIREG